MQEPTGPVDNKNQKFEDAKNEFIDIVFKIIGICWLMFFFMFRSIFRGFFGFIAGAVMLYIMVGGVVITVAHVFGALCHLYIGH